MKPAQPTSDLVGHILGFHVTQIFLYVARIFPSLTPLVGRWAWWLSKEDSVVVDDGYKVLNFDCLVRFRFSLLIFLPFLPIGSSKVRADRKKKFYILNSSLNTPWNGPSTPKRPKHACKK